MLAHILGVAAADRVPGAPDDPHPVVPAPDSNGLLSGPPLPRSTLWFCLFWLLPVVVYFLLDWLTQQRRRTFRGAPAPQAGPERGAADGLAAPAEGPSVLAASIEHSLPHRNVKVIAGGLGKVMDLVARHHPSEITMVHPAVGGDDGGLVSIYGEPDGAEPPLHVVVDGREEEVVVRRFCGPPPGPGLPEVQFLLLLHPLFLKRSRRCLYPNPMTRTEVLAFFSLWNQAVGALLVRHRPRIFHCPDFHTAVAPWYALPEYPDLRLLLVLHNAEYQGSISTDQIRGAKVDRIASIFNLSADQVQKHLVLDGRFNMLKAAVDFLLEHQRGVGACAVSEHYALEVRQLYGLLWRLPAVQGLENPMLEEERVEYDDLHSRRATAKAAIQRQLGLNQDPSAKIFVSLGRLVRQKGVDLLADVAPWLLENYPKAQLIIVGPVADGFGHYAGHHMQGLAEDERFRGRVFVKCEFQKVGDDLRFAADFCLMPSRDEPFGYVDVEFAWCGALVVGAQAGGLGKVPGFYYVAQNKENLSRLRRELRRAIALAMRASDDELRAMSDVAVRCAFPLEAWQRRLRLLYGEVLGAREGPPARPSTGPPPDPEHGGPRPGPQAATELCAAAPGAAPPGPGPPPPQTPRTLPRVSASWGRWLAHAPQLLRGEDISPVRVSLVASQEAGGGLGSFGAGAPTAAGADGEFLTQELSEEELQVAMASKMHLKGIDQILEAVGCEVDESRETSAASKWLLRPTFGTHRIHWVVACGYVMAPLGEVLTFTVASEWALRAQSSWVPGWLPGKARDAISGPMDPSLLRVILFSTNALAMCIGLPWWTWLCKKTEPRWALAGALLGQLLLLAGFLPVDPNLYAAVALMFLHGFIAGASMLFVVFNFMMSIRADVSQAALRMGRMETVRYCVSWLATAFVYLASPDGVPGTKEDPLPAQVLLLAAPLGIGVALSAGVAGALCLFAPRPYREDRFPAWDLGLIFHKRSFVCLALSECIGSLMAFPALSYASWWLDNGWQADELAEVSVVLAVVLAIGVMIWAQVLSLASVHGFSLLISVAVFLLPPSLLAALCQMEVSSFEYRGRSYGALAVCALTLLLQGMQSSAIWAAKIRILGSRWRLLSYCTVLLCASQFCTFLSPIVCEYIARQYSVSFMTRNQAELATAVAACVVPLGVAQYLAQLAAAPFIHGDMGSARHRLHEAVYCSSICRPRAFAARRPIFLAAAIGGGLLAWLARTEYLWLDAPLPFDPVRKCHQLPEQWVGVGCRELATKSHIDFGLNEFGQDTSAKMACHEMMRKESGDTFELRDVMWYGGTCRVLACASKERLMEAHGGPVRGDVYSQHCTLFGQNLVVVHLFEWRWSDIAKECTAYLGPAGFDAVQVSPPMEHALGSPWFTRYQPVSYKLDSRSGTETEFIDMVRTCRNAGVSIMVDTVINHMASKVLVWPESDNIDKPFECDETAGPASNLKCEGWSGTRYGDRHFWEGNASYLPEEFHHYSGTVRSNCALPPWTNNRHLCDLQGLPDLDTEQKRVVEKLTKMLARLYEIGVTMLRVDAAMLIYPVSTAQILQTLPWDYVVQESTTPTFSRRRRGL
ncbi:unnamed protein product [Prorocentrum cordatum]|uniref:alpha-amylase n=1 Tax=Prorocentrum cordatum TaxID=2364126 RepID=A0ABN9V4L0_9DINO|nr:unnamed protein product [Polarella glacialis]